jgi:hypothetical protein
MKPTKLQIAEHEVVCYYHCPEIDTGLSDVLKSDYWTHVTKSLRVGHRIEVLAADGSWWAMLIVRAVGSHDAVVQELQHVELGSQVEAKVTDSPYEVKWRGPARKFGVLRKEDGEIIRDEFQVKEHAVKWLKNHMRNLAA